MNNTTRFIIRIECVFSITIFAAVSYDIAVFLFLVEMLKSYVYERNKMWVLDYSILPYQIKEPTTIYMDADGPMRLPRYPLIVIGTDSYMWLVSIQSGVGAKGDYCHNLQIGNFCSIAKSSLFLIDCNHDYKSVTTSAASFMRNCFDSQSYKIKRKGQILIENDVWMGHETTVLSGVTIHDGAVVAARSVVASDVPPYAVVAGNPARIIKYRFPEEQIEKLECIRWWDWPTGKLRDNAAWFEKDITEFTERFYPEALREQECIQEPNLERKENTYLFIPDFHDAYPIWKNVIKEFCEKFHDGQARLLLYYPDQNELSAHAAEINELKHPSAEIVVYDSPLPEECAIFKKADYFITTRDKRTVYRVGCAERYGLKVVSGVDVPIF
jgi:virginiamycin A acetyltransferase